MFLLSDSVYCGGVSVKDWLAVDCPHARLLSIEYDTELSEWAPHCPYELQRYSSLLVI